MVRLIKHKQIDFDKWDACASRTPNQMIYAYSKYLNAVTNHQWDALVWNDYETIMPLPWNKKLVKKQVYLPNYLQQLGPFGNLKLIKESQILNKLEKKYIQYIIATSFAVTKESIVRRNLTLPLNGNYSETIYSCYKKNRKYDSRQSHKVTIKTLSVKDFLEFYSTNSNELISSSNSEFEQFLITGVKQKFLLLVGAYSENKLCSIIGVTDWNKRLTLILSSTQKNMKPNANAILLDRLFKNYSEKDYLFDFEGSEIEGVAKYFKSFGAIENQYFITQKVSKFYNLLKK